MESEREIRRAFLKLMADSMTPRQIEYIAKELNNNFNLHKECDISTSMAIPSQTAAEAVIHFFRREDDILSLFASMLNYENKKLKEHILIIHKRNHFIKILKKHKWVYDEYTKRFHRDPFYEHEINLLKSLRIIDLRNKIPYKRIISEIDQGAKNLGDKNLNWKITIRLFELNDSSEELINKIIEMLLKNQNLERHTNDLFFCLKELASNASKGNYKVVFEKNMAPSLGLNPDKDYKKFIDTFNEKFKNTNDELINLVKKNNIFFNIFMQSTVDSIAIWVANYTIISEIEKKRIYKKLNITPEELLGQFEKPDKYSEGAGMGINLVKEVLNNLTTEKEPIKLFFYPDYFKIGFVLKRAELEKK